MKSDHVFSEEAGQLKFVGNFEALYNSDPDPWGQSGCTSDLDKWEYYYKSRERLLNVLKRVLFLCSRPRLDAAGKIIPARQLESLMEIGCGHGHVTNRIARELSPPLRHVFGVDISWSAIKRANELFDSRPTVSFYHADVCSPYFQQVIHMTGPCDIILLGQALWYVIHKLEHTLLNVWASLKPGGLFIISQAFLRNQRYGTALVNGFDGLVKVMADDGRFALLEASFDYGALTTLQDGLLVYQRK